MKIKDVKKVEELKKKLNGENTTNKKEVKPDIPDGYIKNSAGELTNVIGLEFSNTSKVKVKSNFKGKIILATDSTKPINFSEELIMTKEEYGETVEITHQFVQYLKRHHPNVFKKGHLIIVDKEYIKRERMDRVMPKNCLSDEKLKELFGKDEDGYITDKDLIISKYNNGNWDEKTLIAKQLLELIKADEVKRSDEEFLTEEIKIES